MGQLEKPNSLRRTDNSRIRKPKVPSKDTIKIPETIQVFLEKPQPRVYQGLLGRVGALKRESRQYEEGPRL